MPRAGLALLGALAGAGCGLYFNGDDPVPPCSGGSYGNDGLAVQSFYDPALGICIGRGPSRCDSTCGPCPETTAEADLGLCYSECTDRGESSCLASAGCIASYEATITTTDDSLLFTGCWQTVPAGPVQGACAKLDAYSCAQDDDCSLVYDTASSPQRFSVCIDEPPFAGCLAEGENPCTTGYHCEDQCMAEDGGSMSACKTVCVANTTCDAVDCASGTTCAILCEDTAAGGVCGPTCVPAHDPGSCTGAVTCFANAPACPSGTTAGIRDGCWTGYCIPNAACSPGDPGQCYLPVTCDAAPPSCPTATTPGIVDGCYTGYCIPTSSCGSTSCELLATDSACTSRADCTAVYTGSSCTCTASGCTCQSVTFHHCES